MNNGQESVIAEGVVIVGTVQCGGDMRFDGKLEGELTCGGNVTLGRTATVKGNITGTSVSIEGRLEGNIRAKDKIEMKAAAVVNGDIQARRLSVEDGVTFVGRSEVMPNGGSAQAV